MLIFVTVYTYMSLLAEYLGERCVSFFQSDFGSSRTIFSRQFNSFKDAVFFLIEKYREYLLLELNRVLQ